MGGLHSLDQTLVDCRGLVLFSGWERSKGPDFYIGPSGLAYGAVSTDGLAWQTGIDGNGVDGVVAHVSGRFVAIGQDQQQGVTASVSEDGLAWTTTRVTRGAPSRSSGTTWAGGFRW